NNNDQNCPRFAWTPRPAGGFPVSDCGLRILKKLKSVDSHVGAAFSRDFAILTNSLILELTN
ncbi:MAG: hypothetical protein WBH05_06045, partial [Syntrophobacteria bacterium]